MSFAQPSASNDGARFDAHEHKGRLVIVFPKSFNPAVTTSKGVNAAADVDVVVVDSVGPDGKPLYFQDARIFGNLAKSVRNDIGGQVLGRVDQVPTAAGNQAWVLQPYTDQDQALATPALTAYQQGLFKQAANPMAQPQQAAQPPFGAPAQAAPAQAYAPAPGAGAPAPAQQWQAPPAQAPAQQQWQAPSTAPTPPAAAPVPAPAAAQWQAPAPAAAPIDPQLIAFLASRGINGPFPDQATAEAIAATLPQ